jgi:hypothetical protein
MQSVTAETFLTRERDAIIGDAEAALARSRAEHYEAAGELEVRRRLELLFDRLLEGIEQRDLGPMIAYSEALAEERFEGGYDLVEVQTAFNALEEATWRRVLTGLDPSEFADALGLISTLLGAGKDALARTYVSLAAGTHAPSLNLRALFAGTD